MMYFVVLVMAAAVLAEPPISKSYLPPSPNDAGYPKGPQGHGSHGLGPHGFGPQGLGPQGIHGPQGVGSQAFQGPQGLGPQGLGPQGAAFPGAPEVVAARSFAQGREKTPAHHGNDFARNNLHDQAHSEGYDNALGRNAENGEPASYNFGYMVRGEGTFGHHEEREDERAQGEYHVVLPDGRKQTVSYEADERGFKPHISYQDSEDLARSGYDSNASDRQFENGGGNHGSGFHGNGVQGHDHHDNGVHGNARSNGY